MGQKATAFADSVMDGLGIELWVAAQTRNKWRWGGHVARLEDGRWTSRALHWQPTEGARKVGRPTLRWTDAFDSFFQDQVRTVPGSWVVYAQSREGWKHFEKHFIRM